MDRITKKIKHGAVLVEFEESVVVVHYDIETVRVDENGRVTEVLDRKPETRRIKIKPLTPDKNLAQMAQDMIEKCKFIHPSRTEEIEQLLIKLRKYQIANPAPEQSATAESKDEAPPSSSGGGDAKKSRRDRERDRDAEQPAPTRSAAREEPEYPPATMDELDDYLELLYQVSESKSDNRSRSRGGAAEDGIESQVRGTAMILQLCRDVSNLEVLIQNTTLMGALTRVLQEEFKKSLELTFNILRIFLAFSNFVEMHSLLSSYKVGFLSMKAIEFEIKRAKLRDEERLAREQGYDAEVKEATKRLGRGSEELKEIVDRVRSARDKDFKKDVKFFKKQDKSLFVGFYILLNLAEDTTMERKMIKLGLVSYLMDMLTRKSADLLILCVTFLKKLSMYAINKNTMKEANILTKLSSFLPCSSQALVTAALRLEFNLSFDPEMRLKMIEAGHLPKTLTLLKTGAFRARALKVLYHFSVDNRCKSMVAYTDGIQLLMSLLINFPQPMLTRDLAGLAINLSWNGKNAELMVANHGLNHLMDRMENARDPLLMKVIRNVSNWSFNMQQELENPETQYTFRGLWAPHIKILNHMAMEATNHDLLIEILGTFANLTSLDITGGWIKLMKDYQLMSFLSRLLVPGMAQPDLLLEIVMIFASAASEPRVCDMIVSTSVLNQLVQLWNDKAHHDEELMLQLMHCFYRLVLNESSRSAVMYDTHVISEAIDNLGHSNLALNRMAEDISSIVLELDRNPKDQTLGGLGLQIRARRFQAYNQMWLQEMGILGSSTNARFQDEYHPGGGSSSMGVGSSWQQSAEAKSSAGYGYERGGYSDQQAKGASMRSHYDEGDARDDDDVDDDESVAGYAAASSNKGRSRGGGDDFKQHAANDWSGGKWR